LENKTQQSFFFFGFPKTNPDLKKKEEEEAEEV